MKTQDKNNTKYLKSELKNLDFNKEDTKTIIESIEDGESHFEVNNYRFIADEEIDLIMQTELLNDLYMLGCFNCWFLADVLDLDSDIIKAMQKAEAFEAIGMMIKQMGKIEELQELYVQSDGYGHHFGHYDGNEIELLNYHIFRVN
jgi:hypothetical protein